MGTVFLLYLIAASGGGFLFEQKATTPLPGKDSCKIEAGIHSGSGIVTDDDGRVWLFQAVSGQQVLKRRIGTAASAGALQPEEISVIAKNEVPTARYQFTCKKSGWRIVALTTLRPIHADERLSYDNVLYVIRFRESGPEVLLRKSYAGINKMALDDLNGDGVPVLAAQWSDGALISPANWLDVWRVSADGELNPISLKNVESEMDAPFASHGSTVDWNPVASGNPPWLVSEQRVVEANGVIKRIRKFYKWNEPTNRYEFASKIVAEEHTMSK